MTITWNVHQPDHYLTLVNTLGNATIAESDASHVKLVASGLGTEVVLSGSFTGNPASDGTITGFRLMKDGQLVLEAEGYGMSLKAFNDAVEHYFVSHSQEFGDLILSEALVVNGSPFGEFLLGGAFNDKMSGGGGDDWITAGAGDDQLKGGAGNDRLWGEDGRDVVKGGPGDDELVGGLGKDKLIGGPGDDQFLFGPEFLKGDVDRIVKFEPGHDRIVLFLDTLVWCR
jgi:Ca2+-binding RTX toxin-like protein